MGNCYTQEFVSTVKETFPNWKEMHDALDSGSDIVGRFLDDNSYNSITIHDILTQDLDTLRKRAYRIQRCQELYHMYVSGDCMDKESMMERYCPSLYLQNNDDLNCLKPDVEAKICSEVGYVGFYPQCKNWGCKRRCWEKYFELIKDKNLD